MTSLNFGDRGLWLSKISVKRQIDELRGHSRRRTALGESDLHVDAAQVAFNAPYLFESYHIPHTRVHHSRLQFALSL